jgi:2-keto-4-pentenoate hydratase/2-oxohepta-3-ene-1,7-dioic acid hydratase in catechol pathway
MRFVTFRHDGVAAEPGVVSGDKVVGLAGAGFPDLLSVIGGGQAARARIEEWVKQPGSGATRPLSSVKLLAPIPRPRRILCVGLNYRDHAAETNAALPDVPTIFAKFATAVIGPGDNIVLPQSSKMPDYEAEFAFVIGQGGRHIPASNWREHVFGYTMLNDVSARDYQKATTQWTMGKNFDTFAPMGPWIVSADEIADPHTLDISLTLNGEVMQNSNTRNLIFPLPELIAFLSSVFTLEPGDVVSTGTPSGVGFARKPPRYLQPGDDVVVRVQGLGELRNPVVRE